MSIIKVTSMKTLNKISRIFHTEPNVTWKMLFSRTKVKKEIGTNLNNYLIAMITATDDFMIFMYYFKLKLKIEPCKIT